MSDLNTMVHVESLRRSLSVRKTSATPASPERVATRMCSTYLDLGGAAYDNRQYTIGHSTKHVSYHL